MKENCCCKYFVDNRIVINTLKIQINNILKKIFTDTNQFIILFNDKHCVTILKINDNKFITIYYGDETTQHILKFYKPWIKKLKFMIKQVFLHNNITAVPPLPTDLSENMMKKQDWVIVFKNNFDQKSCKFPIKIKDRYHHAINGICCCTMEMDLLKNMDFLNVESYSPNNEVYFQVLKERKILTKNIMSALAVQPAGGFILRTGANHSSQKSGDGTGSLSARTDINVFVVDTGIYPHPDLNIVGGKNFTSSNINAWKDDNGHGTHVAGIIGAKDNDFGIVGVAPGARLWALKVLGSTGAGSTSNIINALNWVLQNRGTLWKGIGIVNLSLGGGVNSSIDTAVNNLINNGIVVCVAAGNSNVDAQYFSPARVTNAITVGATQPNPSYNYLASYSNYGKFIDILAPGSNIHSTYLNGYASLSGTSMATPVVTGTIAVMLSTRTVSGTNSLNFALNIKNILTSISTQINPINYDKTVGNNSRISIPSQKNTTPISVWAGSF